MDILNQSTTQLAVRLRHFVALIWYTLCAPKIMGVLLVILVIVLGLALIFPQQTELAPLFTSEATWITGLPPGLQPAGEILFSLGFSRILQSLWFWLPAALLLLHSLIAAADYGPRLWARLDQKIPPIEWQYPFAHRVEHSVRLPDTPNDFLEARKRFLENEGFSVSERASSETEPRMLGAKQRRWSWGGILLFYGGLITLIIAFWISHRYSEGDRFTLSALQVAPSALLEGRFELKGVQADQGASQVIYFPATALQSPQTFTWRQYQPTFLNDALIVPTAIEPLLTVEVRDQTGKLLDLTPLQQELATTERLVIPADQLNTPIYFSIPDVALAFQISPDPAAGENAFNVQVRRGPEATLVENIQVSAGQVFEIDSLSAAIFLNYTVKVFARRDPALLLYGIGMLLIVGGVILTLLRPPVQIWLIPEIKGRGGQLYGVVETIGSEKRMVQFLERLLEGKDVELDESNKAQL